MQKKMNKKMPKGPKTKSARRQDIPAARPRVSSVSAPTIRTTNSGDGRILVRHREYVADVVCETAFTRGVPGKSWPINPGQSDNFPWLSNIANNYEFYQFNKLDWEYHPSCGTQKSGTVMMGVDFDVVDTEPTSKQRMMSYQGAAQGPVYSPLRVSCTGLNLKRFGAQRYTRPGTWPAGADKKTYDMGAFHIYTDGADPGSFSCGSLYVSYEVVLCTPHSPASFPWEDSVLFSSVVATKLAPFTNLNVVNADPSDPTVVYVDPTGVTMKAGQYLLEIDSAGTGLTAGDLVANWTSAVGGFTVKAVSAMVNAAATAAITRLCVTLPLDGKVIYTPPGAWTTLTSVGCRMASYAYVLG